MTDPNVVAEVASETSQLEATGRASRSLWSDAVRQLSRRPAVIIAAS